MKLDISIIQDALAEAKVPPDKQSQVIDYVKTVLKEEKDHKEESSTPKSKYEFGVIIYDKENTLLGKEFSASVYQVVEGCSHSNVLAKISSAAKSSNDASKRKKNIIKTVKTL